MSVAMA